MRRNVDLDWAADTYQSRSIIMAFSGFWTNFGTQCDSTKFHQYLLSWKNKYKLGPRMYILGKNRKFSCDFSHYKVNAVS